MLLNMNFFTFAQSLGHFNVRLRMQCATWKAEEKL